MVAKWIKSLISDHKPNASLAGFSNRYSPHGLRYSSTCPRPVFSPVSPLKLSGLSFPDTFSSHDMAAKILKVTICKKNI